MSADEDFYGDGLDDSEAYYRGPDSLNYVLATGSGAPQVFPGGGSLYIGGGYLNENRGPNGQLNPDGATPELPDMMSMVTDGFGGQTVWTYYPLSSTAGRTASQTPLYTVPSDPALKYVDDRHVYFTSSMPVVSDMSTSDGIGGFHSIRYGYSQAIYNQYGRGFQGFRTIIEEDLTAGLRSTTTFNQKFPLAGQVADVVVNAMTRSGTDGMIRHEVYTWLCDRADRSDTTACTPPNGSAAVKFPFLDEKDTYTFDATVGLQPSGAPQQIGLVKDINASDPNCAGAIATTSGFDAYGNLVQHTVLDSDSGTGTGGFRSFLTQNCVNTVSSYSPNASNWWLNKLNSITTVTKIAYDVTNHPMPIGTSNPLQRVSTAFTWNSDRTLATQVVQSGITKALGLTDQQKSIVYTYPSPSYGLPIEVDVTAAGDVDGGGNARTRTTSIGYSADNYFPASSINSLGQTTKVTTSPRDGQSILKVDENGLRTLMGYDPFGQMILTQFHGTTDSVLREPDRQMAITWCAVGCNAVQNHQMTVVQDGTPTQTTIFDILGRTTATMEREQDGVWSWVYTNFNSQGLLNLKTEPFRTGDPDYATTMLYDALGRMTQKIVPKGAEDGRGDLKTTYTYNGLQTAIQVCGTKDVDTSKCLNMTRTTNSLGQYMETVDALNGVTQYWYDGTGNTLALKDAKNAITRATYNALSQRTSVNDPNQGISSFVYDALGEVVTGTDARGISTTTGYDALGRPSTRTAIVDVNGDGVADTVTDSWTYDALHGIGELATSQRMVYPGQVVANGAIERSQTHYYDTLARLSKTVTSQQIAAGVNKTYTQTMAYDGYYGWPKSIGYPNGEAVATYYSQYGHAIRTFNPADNTTYRQVMQVDARGQPIQAVLGNGTSDWRSYRPSTGEITGIELANSTTSANIRELNYHSDVFGNLTAQYLAGGSTAESYTYDALQRMVGSTRSGGVTGAVAYNYDAAGNFTSKSDFSTTAANAYTYTGATCGGGANAVKSIALATGGTRTYCYDANGNLTSDSAGLAVKYDQFNLPFQTTRGSMTINLAYGPDNQRTRQWGNDGTKVYLGGGYEDWISAGSTKVYVGSEAEITIQGSTRTVNYLLTDRLGSVDTIADGAGNLVETRGSDPFGQPRLGTWADAPPPAKLQSTAITAHGFTGHEHLNSVQLIHMNGRVYDYQIGRFLSVDPLIQAPLNSQSLNPYSYVLNNPLAGTDPTGYSCQASTAGNGDASANGCMVPDNGSREVMTGTHIPGYVPIGMEAYAHFYNTGTGRNGAQEQAVMNQAKPSALPMTTANAAPDDKDSMANRLPDNLQRNLNKLGSDRLAQQTLDEIRMECKGYVTPLNATGVPTKVEGLEEVAPINDFDRKYLTLTQDGHFSSTVSLDVSGIRNPSEMINYTTESYDKFKDTLNLPVTTEDKADVHVKGVGLQEMATHYRTTCLDAATINGWTDQAHQTIYINTSPVFAEFRGPNVFGHELNHLFTGGTHNPTGIKSPTGGFDIDDAMELRRRAHP